MKKLISILLVTVMLVAMIPAAVFTTTATTVVADFDAPTTCWDTDWDMSWYIDAMGENYTPADGTATNEIYTWRNGSENSGETIKVQLNGYSDGQVFYIDTAEELAGLSKACKDVDASYFEKCTFYITDDIDLAEHQWYPIAMTQGAFRGNLIGSKGASDSTNTGNGGSVEIRNMTFNTAFSANWNVGLIGIFKTGSIKNLDLVGAKIASTKWITGSFVGWQADVAEGYENLTSDAKIYMPWDGADPDTSYWDIVGGIVGYVQSPVTNGFKNCTFTGSIDALGSDAVGGIVGKLNNVTTADMVIDSCVVAVDHISYGYDNHYQANAGAEWRVGMGGVIGQSEWNNGGSADVKVIIKNTYVSGDLYAVAGPNRYNKTNAGFVGNACGPVKFENCQFDGMMWDSAEKVSAFISRTSTTEFVNCVNTGVAVNIGSAGGYGKNALCWVSQGVGDASAPITNCYTSANELVVIYGTARPTQITSETEFTGLDFTSTWTKREGSMYPVLTIAKDLAPADSITRGGVDMTWFDFSLLSMEITTEAQLKGVDYIYGALLARDKESLGDTVTTYQEMLLDRIILAPTFQNADLNGYSEAIKNFVYSEFGIDPNAVLDASRVNVQFSQISLVANEKGNYDVRIAAKINDGSYKNVYFNYNLDQDGEITKSMTTPEITTCYRKLIEVVNGEEKEIVAEDGYYVVFVIPNVTFKEVESSVLAVRAYATGGDGTVYYSGQHVNITLAAPTAN